MPDNALMVPTYIEKALDGTLYRKKESVYAPQDITYTSIEDFDFDTSTMTVIVDKDGDVHALSFEPCARYLTQLESGGNMLLLELNVIGIQDMLRKKLVVDPGIYPGMIENTYLEISPRLGLLPCASCAPLFYERKFDRLRERRVQ
jgi:hypothetical protein